MVKIRKTKLVLLVQIIVKNVMVTKRFIVHLAQMVIFIMEFFVKNVIVVVKIVLLQEMVIVNLVIKDFTFSITLAKLYVLQIIGWMI